MIEDFWLPFGGFKLQDQPVSPYLFCVAPMMEWTDRHERYLLRLISPNVRLYTEMVSTSALMHGDKDRFLSHDKTERPLGLQLGGCVPEEMAFCSSLGEQYEFNEININAGCPSNKVQSGMFGACLMRQPHKVARCIEQMRKRVSIPITVKCRISVDNDEQFSQLYSFTNLIKEAGVDAVFVHARKAILSGLTPKQNREIPPLQYSLVYTLKKEFPDLTIVINGGIKTEEDVRQHLIHVDGVMIGREAYRNPWSLRRINYDLFAREDYGTRFDILEEYKKYIAIKIENGIPLKSLTKHLLGLFHGEPGARLWRKVLSDSICANESNIEVIDYAQRKMESKSN